MPTYELSLILRQMPRPEIVTVLKRTAEAIFEKGGFIRKLDNLGTRPLPFKTSSHGLVHRTGSYFVFKFDTPPSTVDDLEEEYGRDVDIIRKRIYKADATVQENVTCTLHDEMLPPAYRNDVQKMISAANKYKKKGFQYNSGFDYYPFQK
ncbi:probable 28S ribosomal protein S6, mitochondrial [Toxorhynchites rutilus septentrionalis]|uniref:probable 28S ribosomal protein S6, mitochondrial n=1 Tax=Toxorhynchites rutilus septentrionalis TaxID=329112 RepID=UPI002478A1F8|nr:probable 28S ribosomal protein S6, mitochondrial [Toxorhynchites rutilus septentrionalis]